MALMALILMLIYSWDRRFLAVASSAALGILVTAVLGAVFTDLFQIHGAVMESSESLPYAGYQHLDATKIFVASIFLGSSGAVMDLPVDICSAGYACIFLSVLHRRRFQLLSAFLLCYTLFLFTNPMLLFSRITAK